MDGTALVLGIFVGMTIAGAAMEARAAYRAHRRHQAAEAYRKQLRETGLRRPTVRG